jgi:ABC-type nitrate/sulfonate/bicarbonate transport system ATPase subunit
MTNERWCLQTDRMTASVDIDDVTLTYKSAGGGVLALQGTTLNVRRGEFAAVVGPSGCGKSSLMKLVTGLLRPDSGDIVTSATRCAARSRSPAWRSRTPTCCPGAR